MNWLEKFKGYVAFLDDSDDSCWIWTGGLRDDGRGRFQYKGREERAHRVAWQLLNGAELPRGMKLRQECDHPQCVRHWRIDRPNKKLTAEQVRQIRASNIPSHALAVRYGVSSVYIRSVRCGMARRSVPVRTDLTGENDLGERVCLRA